MICLESTIRHPNLCRAAALWALLLVAVLSSCRSTVPEAQRLERHETRLERPLSQRVRIADTAVLERAHLTNLDYGQDIRPRAAAATHPLLPLVVRVLAELPTPVARLAERHLTAVYLVEGDVGTATTEGVRGADGRWRHAYIALNLSALERDANAWATWKENSAFRPSGGWALRMEIEPAERDDRLGAVRFILLHELGHVLGLGLGAHGYWDDPPPAAGSELPPFVAQSWRLVSEEGAARIRPRSLDREPRLTKLAFYAFDDANHALDEASELYASLGRTAFPSLYGATNPYDDFAEAFAIYVHTQVLGKPYAVAVLKDGRPVRTYRSCIQTGGCEWKANRIRALLDNAPTGPRIHLGIGAGIGVTR